MAFHTLFPTFIYQEQLGRPSLTKSLFKQILSDARGLMRIDEQGLEWSRDHYQNGYTSYGSLDRLHEGFPAFQELAKHLQTHVKRFAKKQSWDLGDGGLELVTMWINIMPPGTVHSLHLHPLSVVSGTFYVNTPTGTSPIKFEDPRLDRYMAQPPRHPSTPTREQPFYTVEPTAGDVVLFDSWLRHEVPQTPASTKIAGKVAGAARATTARNSRASGNAKNIRSTSRNNEFDLASTRISVSFNYDWL